MATIQPIHANISHTDHALPGPPLRVVAQEAPAVGSWWNVQHDMAGQRISSPKKLVLAASKLVFWGPKHWEMKGLDPLAPGLRYDSIWCLWKNMCPRGLQETRSTCHHGWAPLVVVWRVPCDHRNRLHHPKQSDVNLSKTSTCPWKWHGQSLIVHQKLSSFAGDGYGINYLCKVGDGETWKDSLCAW